MKLTFLRIGHLPGKTPADSHYRYWESLFPDGSYKRRVACLEAAGLRIEELENDVKRSLSLLTEVEVMTRLYSQSLSEARRVHLDALATLLRVARSLAQRRGRGQEIQSLHLLELSTSLLGSETVPPSIQQGWLDSLLCLARDEGWSWSAHEIRTTAEHTPSRVLFEILNDHSRVAGRAIWWRDAARLGTALDWVTRDLMLLIKPGGISTHHVGPISNLLYREAKDQALLRQSPKYRPLILRSVQVMDAYAEGLYPYLTDPRRRLPEIVRDHLQPPFELARIVISSLSKHGVV
ncbi:hypothetical protein [Arthrobacter sp. 2MCAF14]|uniref:hypothetical protein n=1 Tax=Arthrobacter sp. 2MCAF14 TaxID=3232982 RepID=UPI003F93C2CE